MADSFEEVLIEEVRKRSFLYDVSSKLYRDKLKKELAWEEIAIVCGRKVNECKIRWKSLRDKYRKEILGGKLKSGMAATPKNYHIMSLLSFLKDSVLNRTSMGNMECENRNPNTDTQIESTNPNTDAMLRVEISNVPTEVLRIENESFIEDEFDAVSETECSDSISKTEKRVINKNKFSPRDRLALAIENSAKSLAEVPKQSPAEQFCLSLVPYLEKFPPVKQLEVQKNIIDVIYNAIKE